MKIFPHQQNYIIYFKIAKRLDLKCFHHRKEMIIMDITGVLAKAMVVITL